MTGMAVSERGGDRTPGAGPSLRGAHRAGRSGVAIRQRTVLLEVLAAATWCVLGYHLLVETTRRLEVKLSAGILDLLGVSGISDALGNAFIVIGPDGRPFIAVRHRVLHGAAQPAGPVRAGRRRPARPLPGTARLPDRGDLGRPGQPGPADRLAARRTLPLHRHADLVPRLGRRPAEFPLHPGRAHHHDRSHHAHARAGRAGPRRPAHRPAPRRLGPARPRLPGGTAGPPAPAPHPRHRPGAPAPAASPGLPAAGRAPGARAGGLPRRPPAPGPPGRDAADAGRARTRRAHRHPGGRRHLRDRPRRPGRPGRRRRRPAVGARLQPADRVAAAVGAGLADARLSARTGRRRPARGRRRPGRMAPIRRRPPVRPGRRDPGSRASSDRSWP